MPYITRTLMRHGQHLPCRLPFLVAYMGRYEDGTTRQHGECIYDPASQARLCTTPDEWTTIQTRWPECVAASEADAVARVQQNVQLKLL